MAKKVLEFFRGLSFFGLEFFGEREKKAMLQWSGPPGAKENSTLESKGGPQ